MCSMEELIPSIGTSVPSPSILSAIICQPDSTFQNVGKLYADVPGSSSLDEDIDSPFDFCDEPLLVSKTHLISISDDGKIWNWLLTAEGAESSQKGVTSGPARETSKQPEHTDGGGSCPSKPTLADMSFKVHRSILLPIFFILVKLLA